MTRGVNKNLVVDSARRMIEKERIKKFIEDVGLSQWVKIFEANAAP